MTDDDKAQMRESSVKVRHALAPDVPDVTDREIEESLWYYYYDVDKTVAYLTSTGPRQASMAHADAGRQARGQEASQGPEEATRDGWAQRSEAGGR